MPNDEPRLSLLDAALELAASLARPVFPLKPGTKDRPLTRWRHGSTYHRATADHAIIRHWWARWPAANIGLPTGHGLVVIDVDPRSGGTAGPAWPATLTARTPSGGLHLYYRSRYTVPNSTGKLAPGVDVRGDGGMVVAPPSRRPEGSYEWLDPSTPVAELPGYLLSAACDAPGGRSNGTRASVARVPFELPEFIPCGERNWTLFRWGCQLVGENVSEAEVARLLHWANETIVDQPLGDEFTPADVEQVIASVEGYRDG